MPERKRTRLAAERVADLIQTLAGRGYTVIGPTVRDGAVVYEEIADAQDLPRGWTDRQEPGRYRLEPRADGAWFGYNLGPQSWKRHLFPPQTKLFTAERADGLFRILGPEAERRPRAFIGVRACELAAIAAQDQVLLEGPFRDGLYAARREGVFIVAVSCTLAAPTCFCASLGTGPQAPGELCDIVLTEVVNGADHWFLAEAEGARGAEVLDRLAAEPCTEDDSRRAGAAVYAAAQSQTRRVDCDGLREALEDNFEHDRWDAVARRCLACGNCTMVCPTCFCTTMEDFSDVEGSRAERWRRWDSCFTATFSYIHGGSVRTSVKARYRQWLTHKLATWIDQFGTPGCVGCGRCITWCPVGIDLTEEARAICRDGNDGNTVA